MPMETKPYSLPLDGEQIQAYQDSGFIIVRGLYSRNEMMVFKAQTKAIVAERHPDDTNGVPVFFLNRNDVNAPTMPQAFQDFCCSPKLTAIVHQLLGPRIEFLSMKPVYKSADVSYPSSWHQDYPYWLGSNKLSVWIALDDATPENGCMRFLPGAHKTPLEHQKSSGNFGNSLSESQIDGRKVVDAPMAAGDACFFIDLAPHASFGNRSGRDRWSCIPTYRNADEPDSSTVWRDSILLEQSHQH